MRTRVLVLALILGLGGWRLAVRMPSAPVAGATAASAKESGTPGSVSVSASASASESESAAKVEARILNPAGLDVENLVSRNPDELPALARAAERIVEKFVGCLGQDLCGDRASPGHPYFDPGNTPHQQALNRALLVLLRAAESAGFRPDPELLFRALEIRNRETQLLAAELLLVEPPSDAVFDRLLSAADQVPGSGKGIYFSLLDDASLVEPSRRERLVSGISRVIAGPDVDTSFQVLSRLGDLRLSAADWNTLAPALCGLRTRPESRHEWPLIRKRLIELGEAGARNSEIVKACES